MTASEEVDKQLMKSGCHCHYYLHTYYYNHHNCWSVSANKEACSSPDDDDGSGVQGNDAVAVAHRLLLEHTANTHTRCVFGEERQSANPANNVRQT